jgi:hypothetical protein
MELLDAAFTRAQATRDRHDREKEDHVMNVTGCTRETARDAVDKNLPYLETMKLAFYGPQVRDRA